MGCSSELGSSLAILHCTISTVDFRTDNVPKTGLCQQRTQTRTDR
uniref:Uncharacterized protein n=1 Tax=Anguilla anguilla TaxID=7936 RepID=A0A0E9TXB9_ANGAN